MPIKYTEQDRADALDILEANLNDIALTSRQTKIPERTLREWRRLHRVQSLLPPDPPSAAAEALTQFHERFPTQRAALEYVRDQFIMELITFADDLPYIMQMAAPYHRLLIFMHIVDRFDKIKSLIPAYEPPIRLDSGGSTHPDDEYGPMNEDSDEA